MPGAALLSRPLRGDDVGRFYHRIMVPIDATVGSEHALPIAIRLAELEKATLALVHVSTAPDLGIALASAGAEGYAVASMNEDVLLQVEQSVERRLIALANEIEQISAARVEMVRLEHNDVSQALADYSEKAGPELIVMTTHDQSRLERLLLGSVAESVARTVHAPTILVKVQEERPDLSRRATIDHVLVPIDGSELSRSILPHVRVIASLAGARVTLFTVVEPAIIAPPVGMPGPAGVTMPSEADASSSLSAHAAELHEIGITADAVVVTDPSSRRAIIEYATEHGVDLIAMSTHGRHGLAKVVAGNVATEVLHHTGIPLLMYRPNE